MRRRLGVNIDHIATLRQARRVRYPDPVESLAILKQCQVDQVTVHLREDRRHIQDHDVKRLLAAAVLPVNLELAVTSEMVAFCAQHKPKMATFVPEKREEITTEGGLDCTAVADRLKQAIKQLKDAGVHVSLFIEADPKQIALSQELGADAIELHTGSYCDLLEKRFETLSHYDFDQASLDDPIAKELMRLKQGAKQAKDLGLKVYGGHGLHCDNLPPVVQIEEIEEYNIGHAIIARSVFVGLETAVREIQAVLNP
ncbi:MAG: pyridoxine 5'-phosphate synthase [Deltaproteobacteria bacterium]|nr:pyridoxine 5'-phosphate synthase [Deltaproteobacteria bacterium]